MSFLVSQAVVVLVDIMLRLALYHEPYTREYEDGGDGILDKIVLIGKRQDDKRQEDKER